jgi:hypothetical protein
VDPSPQLFGQGLPTGKRPLESRFEEAVRLGSAERCSIILLGGFGHHSRGDFRQNGREQVRFLVLLASAGLAVAVLVFVVASAALNLRSGSIDHGNHGVIRYQFTFTAVVVNDVAKAQLRHRNDL